MKAKAKAKAEKPKKSAYRVKSKAEKRKPLTPEDEHEKLVDLYHELEDAIRTLQDIATRVEIKDWIRKLEGAADDAETVLFEVEEEMTLAWNRRSPAKKSLALREGRGRKEC